MCRWCRYAIVVDSHYGIRFFSRTHPPRRTHSADFLSFFSFPLLFAWEFLSARSFFIISSFILFCFARNRFEFILASFCADKSEKLKRTAEICFVCAKTTKAHILLFSLNALTNYSSEERAGVCVFVSRWGRLRQRQKKNISSTRKTKRNIDGSLQLSNTLMNSL